MKKIIAIILTSLSFMIILDSMNAGHAITMFLLAGIVPGTNMVINADSMFELFVLLTGFVLGRVSIGLVRVSVASRQNLLASENQA